MGVGDEHRPVIAGRRSGELVAVDQPDRRLDRIDAEAGEGDIEERHRRQHDALDPVVVAQVPYRAFQHERRTGHGVEDVAVLGGRGDQALGDLGVDVGEGVGRLVDVVERCCCGDERPPTDAAWCG